MIHQVDGWLTDNEASLLYILAKQNSFNGLIVEIGSWKGKSTICLAEGSLNGRSNKVYAIDPHLVTSDKLQQYLAKDEVNSLKKFKENIENAGVGAVINPVIEFSYNAINLIDNEIDLIFIDGSHKYEDVLNDYNLYMPKVRVGGIVAFHDTNDGGPNKVVREKLYRGGNFKNVRFVDSITYGEKTNKVSIYERIKRYHNLMLFNFYNRNRSKQMPRALKAIAKSLYRLVIKR